MICVYHDYIVDGKLDAEAISVGWKSTPKSIGARVIPPGDESRNWTVRLYDFDSPALTDQDLQAIGFTRCHIMPSEFAAIGYKGI